MKGRILRLLSCLIAFLSLTALAQDKGIPWSYEWTDAQGKHHLISLTIDRSLAEKAYLDADELFEFKEIGKVIVEKAKTRAHALSDNNVKLVVKGKTLGDYSIESVRSAAYRDEASRRIQMLRQYIHQEVLAVTHSSHYVFSDRLNNIIFDYPKIARAYLPLIKDLVSQVINTQGIETVEQARDLLLSMLQSMPYDDLMSEDMPLYNPVRLLMENKGDCESKQIVMAAAMKILIPDTPVHLIQLPTQQHIVMGYEDADGQILLMDATGPGFLPAGELHSRFHLRDAIFHEIIF